MELLNYLLKVSACSVLFLAFYMLVLRKLTFFKINRFYLLGSLFVSFLIPATQLKLERIQDQLLNENTALKLVSEERFNDFNNSITALDNISIVDFVPYFSTIYILIALGLLSFTVLKLIKLIRCTKSRTGEIDGLIIIPKESGFTNCSFFNYVFINKIGLTEHELEVLLQHEHVHAKELHSVDKVILMVLKSILWFNPLIYLYDQMIEEAHEFEADQKTSANCGTKSYAQLLLKLAVEQRNIALVHNFVKSPLKKRIKMLFISKSNNMKKLIYALALPIVIGLVWGFTVKVVYASATLEPTQNVKSITSTKILDKTTLPKSVSKNEVAPKTQFTKAVEPADDAKPIYARYSGIDSRGEPCDIVEITLVSGSWATVEVKKNGKAVIIINGTPYSEEEMKVMSKNKIANIKSVSAVDNNAVEKYYPQLADKYDGVIELPARRSFN